MNRCLRGESPHALVLEPDNGIASEDVERFWSDFVPIFAARHTVSWIGMRSTVEESRARYGRRLLHNFERIAGLYSVLLFAKLEPFVSDTGSRRTEEFTLQVKSYFHLRLLANHIIAHGRESYDAVVSQPLLAQHHVTNMTMQSGAAMRALFRYESLVYQSQKLRLMDVFMERVGGRELSDKERLAVERTKQLIRRSFGALGFSEFLKTQFMSDEDILDVPESLPRFAIHESAEIIRVQAV